MVLSMIMVVLIFVKKHPMVVRFCQPTLCNIFNRWYCCFGNQSNVFVDQGRLFRFITSTQQMVIGSSLIDYCSQQSSIVVKVERINILKKCQSCWNASFASFFNRWPCLQRQLRWFLVIQQESVNCDRLNPIVKPASRGWEKSTQCYNFTCWIIAGNSKPSGKRPGSGRSTTERVLMQTTKWTKKNVVQTNYLPPPIWTTNRKQAIKASKRKQSKASKEANLCQTWFFVNSHFVRLQQIVSNHFFNTQTSSS